jgi:transcriptional regulator with XRE-family HTH domain
MTKAVKGQFGEVLRRQRISASLTLQQLSRMSGISASHLGRIEHGERFPSASVLRKLARPLGFDENDLFTLAGYLTPQNEMSEPDAAYEKGRLAPYVAKMLAEEPIEIQHAVIGMLTILNAIARSMNKK